MTAPAFNHSTGADEVIARYDPCTSWDVYTPNQNFKGTVHKTEFVSGHGFIQGLPRSASGEQKLEISAKLAWFEDRGYTLERSKRAVKDE